MLPLRLLAPQGLLPARADRGSERFRSLPASDYILPQANRIFGRLFFSTGRAMRWYSKHT
jgi:hypothetical protein